MKKCNKCGEEKEISEFSIQKGGKDGVRRYCKSCGREYTKKYKDREKVIVESKICGNCNTEKRSDEYHNDKYMKDGLKSTCKECNKIFLKNFYNNNKDKVKNYQKKYIIKNKEKINEYYRNKRKREYIPKPRIKKIKEEKVKIIKPITKEGYKICNCCKNELPIENFNKDQSSRDEHSYKCRECCKEYSKIYRKEHPEISRSYHAAKRKNDTTYKLKRRMSKRIRDVIKGRKSTNTMKLSGCTINELKEHLQQTAIANGYSDFDINNYDTSKFHIDHIIPCDAFNLSCSYHHKLCFNYTNLQILTAEENLLKLNNFNIDNLTF